MALPENPITRKEAYLAKIAGQEVQIPDVPITREEAYLDEIAKNGGGGGGTNNYEDLNNLPQVNGVELRGNKTSADLGLQGTLTFDNTPTDGSNNPVKSDGIYDSEKDIYAVMGQMGAKNLVNVTAESTTIQHVTFMVNADGTISTTGTSTADFSTFVIGTLKLVPGKKYVITGSDAPDSSTFYIRVRGVTDTSENYYQITDATEFIAGQSYYTVNLRIYNNINMDGITFYPMVRLASDTDNTYQPYAKTNKQLTDEIATKVDKVTGKGLSTNDYTNTDKADVAKVANKADKTATASGETLALVPTSEGRALLHMAYGMSTQSGTPTPSEPVDIVSAKVDFRCVGKNLIPYPWYETSSATRNGVSYTLNGQSVMVNREASSANNANFWIYNYGTDFMGLKSGRYVLSGSGSEDVFVSLTFYQNNTWVSQINAGISDEVVDIDTESTTYNNIGITIFTHKTGSLSNVVIKPMLRLANVTDETYEPYKETDLTTNLTLRAIEVSSTDNYNLEKDGKYYIADTLDYSEDNGFVVTRRVGEYEVLGNEGWIYIGDAGSKQVYIAQSSLGISAKNSTTEQGCSSHFVYNGKTVSSITWGNYYFSINNLVISVNNSDITDITTAESWLSSNKPKFDYVLVTPTTENITTAQALALLGLKTYDESTTISSQAEPACTIAVEYAKERLGALSLTAYNTAKGNDIRITALEG